MKNENTCKKFIADSSCFKTFEDEDGTPTTMRDWVVGDIRSGKFSVPNTEIKFTKFINDTLKIQGLSMIPNIKKVVYDIPNNTTIVYFEDGTKEIARVMEADTFDKEVGVMQCIVKKMYGGRSKWLKEVVNNGIEVKPKKVKGE